MLTVIHKHFNAVILTGTALQAILLCHFVDISQNSVFIFMRPLYPKQMRPHGYDKVFKRRGEVIIMGIPGLKHRITNQENRKFVNLIKRLAKWQ